MADHKTDTGSLQFTTATIERGIAKLRRRIDEVKVSQVGWRATRRQARP